MSGEDETEGGPSDVAVISQGDGFVPRVATESLVLLIRPRLSQPRNLHRLVSHREEAGGFSGVDICDKQSALAVGLVAEQRPIGPHHR